MNNSRGRSETRLQGWAFAWFFCLLAGYFLLRPVRETIGVMGGESRLSWLYTATFVAMLATNPIYAWAVAKLRRQTLVPALYVFFASHLGLFCIAFAVLDKAGRALAYDVFFVWLSVFNLSAVTTFWGLLADVFDRERAKNRFGMIGAGGTAGAIAGSLAADFGSKALGFVGLLTVASGLLLIAAFCAQRVLLECKATDGKLAEERAFRSPVLQGWRDALATPYLRTICIYLLLFTITATFVYYEQRDIVSRTIQGDAERTSYYARINYGSNILVLFLQGATTAFLLRRLGIGRALAGVPALMVVGFSALLVSPALAIVSSFEVLRRTSHFALSKPAQEVLFTSVPRDQKYRAKSFIDTVVYRGGDVLAAWVYTFVAQGFGFLATAIFGLALTLAWLPVALKLGRLSDASALEKR